MQTKSFLRSQQKPLEIIQEGFQKFFRDTNIQVFLFGSRARNTERAGSDRDICIQSKDQLAPLQISRLKSYFDETPLSVDLIDISILDTPFKQAIVKDIRPLHFSL